MPEQNWRLKEDRERLLADLAVEREAVRSGDTAAPAPVARLEGELRANDRAQQEQSQRVRRLRELALGGHGEGEPSEWDVRNERNPDRPQAIRGALRAVEQLHHRAELRRSVS